VNSDGCNSTCFIEYGFSCSSSEPSVCHSTCGDGEKASNEGCDDGNSSNNDGCSSSCLIENRSNCNLLINPNLCDFCGNGNRKAPEVCDDPDSQDGKGCASDCMSVLPTWTCADGTSSSPDYCLPKYGDGIIIGDEQCDDKNMINTDGCSNTGIINQGYTCEGEPSICQ